MFKIGTLFLLALAALTGGNIGAQQVVYNTGGPTGFFVPFTRATVAGTRFGDSGWFGSGSDDPVAVTSITLGLATVGLGGTVGMGTTDLVFTFNDGDPSGLIFGPGTELYSETITNFVLPGADSTFPQYFTVTFDLPNVMTSGGFNNFGFSLAVENFNYDGQFGFQNHGNFNIQGSYTNNASQFLPGDGWSLFAFGPNDPQDIANFVASVQVPEAGQLATLAAGSGLLLAGLHRPRRQSR